MTLDSATNNIYHDIKISLKVFSHDGAVALASIYRGTRIYRGTDRSDTCSKCHKTKKCHQKNSFVALSNVTKLRKCCSVISMTKCPKIAKSNAYRFENKKEQIRNENVTKQNL